MTSLRLVLVSGLLTASVYADEPINKSEEAVRREIARLDGVKPLPSTRPLNNVSLSYDLGLNIRTTFTGISGFRPNNPGPATSGVNHTYDDGYNKVDAQGNDHSDQGFPHTTTFWGYQNDSQWNHAANTISMHSAALQSFGDTSNDDPRHGFNIAYERIIGQSPKWYWGIEGSFGFTKIDADQSTMAPVLVTTDAYAIPKDPVFDTFSVPAAPYNGPFSGSLGTSLLSDVPMRSVAPNGDFAISDTHFDANVWQLRLGPKLHLPICNSLELDFGGGLGVAVFDSSFSYQDRGPTTPSLAGIVTGQGTSDSLGAIVGGYLAGQVVFPIAPDERFFVGVQWQDLGKYRHQTDAHVAEVNFSDALSFNIGFDVSF